MSVLCGLTLVTISLSCRRTSVLVVSVAGVDPSLLTPICCSVGPSKQESSELDTTSVAVETVSRLDLGKVIVSYKQL